MPRLAFLLLLPVLALVLASCDAGDGGPDDEVGRVAPAAAATFTFAQETISPTPARTRTPEPSPSATPTAAPTPEPTPSPSPTVVVTRIATAAPTPRPVETARGGALIVGDAVLVRSAPSTKDGEVVARLGHLQEVQILGAVKGERWVVGDQTWPMAYQSWTDTWYRIEGGYVYSAFVFIPRAGEGNAFARTGTRRIDVDVSSQTLRAYMGDQVVYTAGVTTGKAGYETPPGRYTVGAWGRVSNETMTSGQAAINDPAEEYHVKNVLYTQYFTGAGDALHLNYWQPDSVFGGARSSHGCVGLLIHDAQWMWLFAAGGVRLDIR